MEKKEAGIFRLSPWLSFLWSHWSHPRLWPSPPLTGWWFPSSHRLYTLDLTVGINLQLLADTSAWVSMRCLRPDTCQTSSLTPYLAHYWNLSPVATSGPTSALSIQLLQPKSVHLLPFLSHTAHVSKVLQKPSSCHQLQSSHHPFSIISPLDESDCFHPCLWQFVLHITTRSSDPSEL